MKFCEKCGMKISDDALYCRRCGVKIIEEDTVPQLLNQQPNVQDNRTAQTNSVSTYTSQATYTSNNDSQAIDFSTELSVGLNLVSLLIPVLGLILSIVFRNNRPLQAMCCKSNMILGFIICGIGMIFTLIFLTA